MRQEKKIILGTLILAIFVFVVAVSSLYIQTQLSGVDICGCAIPIPLFIPFLASVGLLIGTLFYHFLFPKYEKKMDKELIFRLFDKAERELIEKLLENEGSYLQSKLTRETNLSKVQVFRTLENLIQRKVVKKDPYGKTNVVKLDKDIYNLFC